MTKSDCWIEPPAAVSAPVIRPLALTLQGREGRGIELVQSIVDSSFQICGEYSDGSYHPPDRCPQNTSGTT